MGAFAALPSGGILSLRLHAPRRPVHVAHEKSLRTMVRDAEKRRVIGDVHTFSIEEGFANRAEAGYTRSVHWTGNSPLLSTLWHEAGMNIFNG